MDVKTKNPFKALQKKIRQTHEQFSNVQTSMVAEKRIDKDRIFQINCDIETNIFDKTSKAKKCDVKIVLDHEPAQDPNALAQISIDLSPEKPPSIIKEDDTEN